MIKLIVCKKEAQMERPAATWRAGYVGVPILLLVAWLGVGVNREANQAAPATEAESARAAVAAIETEWRLFRGDPQLRGHRDFSVADTPKLLWAYDTKDSVVSTAAITGGKVYVGTQAGDLLALDLAASAPHGKLLWKYSTEAEIAPSPGFFRGKLYFGDYSGIFHAVDANSGEQAWSFDTEGAEIIASANFFGDNVLFGSYDGYLYCLHSQTGDVVWKIVTGGPIHSSPALVEGKTFVTGCDELLRAVDVANGTEVLQMRMEGRTAASPTVVDTMLYVGTLGNEVLAIDWKQEKVVWKHDPPEGDFPFYSSAAVSGDRLVVGGRDKKIHCLNRKTGSRLWAFSTKGRVDCSPVIAGERVICGSSDKNLYMLDLESGKRVWSYAADGAFLASPSLIEDRLVIGADNGLVYCFDVSQDAPKGPSNGR